MVAKPNALLLEASQFTKYGIDYIRAVGKISENKNSKLKMWSRRRYSLCHHICNLYTISLAKFLYMLESGLLLISKTLKD